MTSMAGNPADLTFGLLGRRVSDFCPCRLEDLSQYEMLGLGGSGGQKAEEGLVSRVGFLHQCPQELQRPTPSLRGSNDGRNFILAENTL